MPDLSDAAVGGTTTDVILATQIITDGTTFSVAIPDSTAAESLISPAEGTINTHTVVVSAQGAIDTYAPVAASAGSPGVAALGTLPAYDPTLTNAYAAAQGISPASLPDLPPPFCVWTTTNRVNDWATRIGEMHVIGGTGVKVSAVYSYEDHADSSFSVGLSNNGTNWSEGGTVTVTNGGSTTETANYPSNYLKYVDAHFDYIKQEGNDVWTCGSEWRQGPAAWDGDIINGALSPPGNPYGGCRNDPNGYSELQAGHVFGHFTSTGVQYDTVANVWNFSFSGHTGYETTNGIQYTNPAGGVTVFLCSTTSPVDNWHVIYNTL